MARKVQISKEIILQEALEMLIESGYSSINIKTLSQKIGCSTQPLVWHFENMEGLRKALSEYALSYANNKMYPSAENPVEAFEKIGREYVKIAVCEPNLFRFLYLDGTQISDASPFTAIITSNRNAALIKKISVFFGISEEKIGQYLQNTIIYAHGIATLVATNVMAASVEEMMTMINLAADAFLIQAGVPQDEIPQY